MSAIIEDALELKVNEWKTLNTAASPKRLPAGNSPDNQNVWMDEKPGSVVTANGYSKLGELPSGLPPTFLIDYFKSSDGSRQLVVSDGQNVYWTTDFVTFTVIQTGLSAFFQLRGKVIRDKLWLTNGVDPVMTWDGTTLVELDGTGVTPNVPKGRFIEYHDERVWMYGLDDDLSATRFSALTDTTGTQIAPDHADAWPTDNEIQISEGDADIGTGIFVYRGYLYCAKQYSIWRIVGYDEYTYSRVKTRASTGTRFQESIQVKDNLVHFIGVGGLYVFDGEDAQRISDIIDPASSDEGVFAFRNLQQPLLNNQFWSVTSTENFDDGNVSSNLNVDDSISLVAVDDSATDFASGDTLTNVDTTTTPGSLILSHSASGVSGLNVALQGTGELVLVSAGGLIGSGSMINDTNLTNGAGFSGFGGILHIGSGQWRLNLASALLCSRIIVKSAISYSGGSVSWSVWINTGTVVTTFSTSSPPAGFTQVGTIAVTSTATNFTVDFTPATITQIFIQGLGVTYTLSEIEIYQTAFNSTGQFISKTLDLKAIPESFGNFNVVATVPSGTTITYYTQSSSNGTAWDAAVACINGGAIGSVVRRYLRWRADFTSDGLTSPSIDAVYLPGQYISAIHNTGGNIFQWSAFQSVFDKAGQTITFYFRAAATSGAVLSEPWTAIVPGAAPSADLTDQYIQIKIEMSTADAARSPVVNNFTVNWILDSGGGVNTLQNVASIVILNRYWLSAATLGANQNDVIIVLGRNSFESPFMKKDFEMLSFCRYQDFYIAGSSLDGSLYRLETGYSKDGAAMDSYYETADLSKDDFQMKGKELLVTADRLGPYDLNVGWSTDGGENWVERLLDLTRESGESLSVTKKFNISFMSDAIRFRVRINAADQPFSVDAMLAYYRLSPQRGSINGS